MDEYAPHPNYIFSKGLPLSEGNLIVLRLVCTVVLHWVIVARELLLCVLVQL